MDARRVILWVTLSLLAVAALAVGGFWVWAVITRGRYM
jgi:hypothetical protein